MGAAERLRALRVARAGAVKARTQAGNELRDLILTAPEDVAHRQLAGLSRERQVDAAARFRLRDLAAPAGGVRAAMASVARRYQDLAAEIARLDAALEELVTHAAPAGFLAKQGVATVVAATLLATVGDNPGRVRKEASFAALCGASPVDASSGKQLRHRLNRGGDRQANSALWTIAMTHLAHDPRTKAYLARRTAEGQDQERGHPVPQALYRPRDLQGPVPAKAARHGIRAASQTRSFGSALDVGASAVLRATATKC